MIKAWAIAIIVVTIVLLITGGGRVNDTGTD